MRIGTMLLLCGCIALLPAGVSAQTGTFTPPAKSPPPTPPVPYEEAIQKAANAVLANAVLPEGSQKIGLVIDPLIDGSTGAESVETQSMEKRIVELAKSKYPRYEILPFTTESLAKSPLL